MDGSLCGGGYCNDPASSSDWLFGLGPGPPQRFEPIDDTTYSYQWVRADEWPQWGYDGDLAIGEAIYSGAAPGGSGGCDQGFTYRGTHNEIC